MGRSFSNGNGPDPQPGPGGKNDWLYQMVRQLQPHQLKDS
jgi:hypothetical protein